MTLTEVANVVRSIGIPFAYHHFPESTGQQPPFICYYYPESSDLKADDTNYQKINELIIELYTDNKDFELEERVEAVLRANDFVFSRVETYIDSEKMYMVAFYTGVVINAEQN